MLQNDLQVGSYWYQKIYLILHACMFRVYLWDNIAQLDSIDSPLEQGTQWLKHKIWGTVCTF